jgi:hypothetical protein
MTLLKSVASALAASFIPLQDALESPAAFALFLEDLGWDIELNDAQFDTLNDALQIAEQIDNIVALANADAQAGDIVAQVVQLAEAIYSAIAALNPAALTSLPEPLDEASFWIDLAAALPQHLGMVYLQGAVPSLFEALRFTGVIACRDEFEAGVPRCDLHWDLLGDLLNDPLGRVSEEYGWGRSFDYSELLERMLTLGNVLGISLTLDTPDEALLRNFYADGSVPPDLKQLTIILYEGTVPGAGGWVQVGFILLPVPKTPTGAIAGLYLTNLTSGSLGDGIALSLRTSLRTEGSLAGSGVLGVLLMPEEPVSYYSVPASLDYSAILEIKNSAPLIGEADGAHLGFAGTQIALSFSGTQQAPEVRLSFNTLGEGLQAVILPADGDSFIQELLGGTSFAVGTVLEFLWSSTGGVTWSGGPSLDLSIPLNLKIWIITLLELHLGLVYAHERLELTTDVDALAELGVFTLVVTDIGIISTISPSDSAEAFAGLDIALAFKPPTGAGIELDLIGIVKGGGYLEHDPDKGEYSGIVTVEMLSLGITAIGIVTTKPPDNPGGWSMFVSINVDLGGIPLGFGFTLEKVGGLVGVHRSINTAAFQEGVRTGLLDSVLFPDDPLANAARILSDIETAFPTAQGSFVFGAMLQIGWGVPTLITGDLGFIIQVPDIIIALIGQVESVLPDDVVPLIEIHFDVVGIIDIAEGTLSIDAGIRDSRLLAYVLTGQMAMRASFIDDPSFLLAVGGFHPAFSPPTGFPTLDRVGFGIGVGDWLSITLETYLALTSNTLQFGAGLYLTASFVGFEIEGGTDINTLITFSPFSFRADLRFYITVSAGPVELLGVLLTGQISGPNPIFVRGVARFKILGIEEEASIEESIGGSSPIDEIDEVNVQSDVVEAFEDIRSWRAVDEGARIGAVLLAEVTPSDGEILVHPGGLAEVVQRLAPLDVELEHYGNAQVEGEDSLNITDVEAGDRGFAWEFSEDWFAPAQFFEMGNDEKLGAPSFEKMNAGIRFGDDSAESGTSVDTIYNYEQIIFDPEFLKRSTKLRRPFIPQQEQVSLFASQKGGAQKPLTSAKPVQKVTLKPTQYVIVERATLTTQRGVPRRKMTFAEANQATRGMSAAQIVVTSAERKAE